MSDQMINLYNMTGFGRLVDLTKEIAGGNPEIPLEHVLMIGRVLFAVVMVGFIGYFFDRTKESVKATIHTKR